MIEFLVINMCEHVPSQSKNSPKGNTTSICQTMNNAMHVNHFRQHIINSSYLRLTTKKARTTGKAL